MSNNSPDYEDNLYFEPKKKMNLVRAGFTFIDVKTNEQYAKKIEYCARNCYKSEGNITKDSCYKMVKNLIASGHTAMLEHDVLTVKLTTDVGAYKDLTRHRLAAYAIESTRWCLSGDTKITKNYSIKDLYDRQERDNYGRSGNARLTTRSCEDDTEQKNLIPNHIKQIYYNGNKCVYEVKTSLGYSIKSTKEHKFLTSSGYKSLEELSIGDEVYVNGRPSLLKIDNNKLKSLYLKDKLLPIEIAELYSVPVASIRRRLKQLNIFVPRLNDKNIEKYFKNHTKESYRKMRNTILKQYENGRTPWNKGITEDESLSVKRQANALRKYHFDGFEAGVSHPNYTGDKIKNGYNRSRYNFPSLENVTCEVCKLKPAVERHHIDRNIRHNDRDNILFVCKECHTKLHKGWECGKHAHLDKIVSIKKIGVEPVYDIEMEEPYHNYIANGFIVHNCNYTGDKFGNELTFTIPYHIDLDSEIGKVWLKHREEEQEHYFETLKLAEQYNVTRDGVPVSKTDIARMELSHSLKADVIITANFREWRHIFQIRCDKHAHPSLRCLMQALLADCINKFPTFFEDLSYLLPEKCELRTEIKKGENS